MTTRSISFLNILHVLSIVHLIPIIFFAQLNSTVHKLLIARPLRNSFCSQIKPKITCFHWISKLNTTLNVFNTLLKNIVKLFFFLYFINAVTNSFMLWPILCTYGHWAARVFSVPHPLWHGASANKTFYWFVYCTVIYLLTRLVVDWVINVNLIDVNESPY